MSTTITNGEHWPWFEPLPTLQWRHNDIDGVSNHQPYDCLLNRLFRHRSKKTSKLWVTGLCEGNSPATGEFRAQRASNAENVSIWWRHHDHAHTHTPPHTTTTTTTTNMGNIPYTLWWAIGFLLYVGAESQRDRSVFNTATALSGMQYGLMSVSQCSRCTQWPSIKSAVNCPALSDVPIMSAKWLYTVTDTLVKTIPGSANALLYPFCDATEA